LDVGTGGCPNPFDEINGKLIDPEKSAELLGDKTRLSKFTITQIQPSDDSLSKMYTLSVRIVYGDSEVLTNPTTENAACLSNITASTHCFVVNLRASVRQGVR
jgi:hypothetical protein